MSNVLEEGNLRFDFIDCDTAERFDTSETNAHGMKSVDFIAETADCLYFIEVKDYQNPNAKQPQRAKDFEKLIKAATCRCNNIFRLEMGAKIKDSLLRKYAEGYVFAKKVVYLLLINLDVLGERERGMLKAKIGGYIPTGLNDGRFHAFSNISFELVNAAQLSRYGIICSDKTTP